MSDDVERNYQVVGLSPRGKVMIEIEGGDPENTRQTPKQWVGNLAALRLGGVFDYFDTREKKILRRGLKS